MDLSFLTPLYELPGPFASLYLDTTRAEENAAREIETRWRSARERLAEQGADDDTLGALDEAVGSHREASGRSGQAVFAAAGRVLLDRVLPTPPRREIARWSRLPHVMPLLAQAPAVVPHVVVLADRTGGEIRAVGPDDQQIDVRQVAGEDHHLRKVHVGGWSHRRILHTAEETWRTNATQVAEQVDDLVRSVGARVLVAAGDVRAREKLRGALPSRSQEILVELDEGGTAPGADSEGLEQAVSEAVARSTAAADQEVIARFEQERGQQDRAAEGLDATVDALRRAQVDTLIIVDDPSSDATLWIGPDPVLLGTRREDLTGLGVDSPVQERADAALVRAAVGTAARLCVAVGGQVQITDGVGAVLRYADASSLS